MTSHAGYDVSRVEARAESLEDAHYDLMRDLIRLRKLHRLSQEVVAERMSVSQPTVASFERYDSNPTLASIRRYALAVGARIQNSVIDDCQEHAMQFESITCTSPFGGLMSNITDPRVVAAARALADKMHTPNDWRLWVGEAIAAITAADTKDPLREGTP